MPGGKVPFGAGEVGCGSTCQAQETGTAQKGEDWRPPGDYSRTGIEVWRLKNRGPGGKKEVGSSLTMSAATQN